MVSKIFFLIALFITVCWIILFSLFNNSIAIHLIAVFALLVFFTSYVTRNNEY